VEIEVGKIPTLAKTARSRHPASLSFSTGMNLKLNFQDYISAADNFWALRMMCNRFLDKTA